MALCEGQLDSALPQLKREHAPGSEREPLASDGKAKIEHNGDVYGLSQVPGGLPLSVDYRSPVSHFVPPAVELYAARQKQEQISTPDSSQSATPVKRKRGRPRIDKTSPEYLANLAARKQAKEMAAVMNSRTPDSGEKRKRGRPRLDKTSPEYLARKRAKERDFYGTPETDEKRKRGRPRVDKTSPEYLARKRARELEALERKAKREYKRRATGAKPIAKPQLPARVMKKLPAIKNKIGLRKMNQKAGNTIRKAGDRRVLVRRNTKMIRRKDSAASSSAGETTPRTKRKYTKRTPNAKKEPAPTVERVKGKRGRPRKSEQTAANSKQTQQPKIRVRNNLMPINTEPISLDSDDEPDLGSPSQASDSLSLDENLRAIRHIHEKYANIDRDDQYEAHLLAANFKKPSMDLQRRDDDDVLSVRSSEGGASVKDAETKVEKLDDSSNSDSDSSSSGSGSSSSGTSSSSSSDSSDTSDSSDSESDSEGEKTKTEPVVTQPANNATADDDRSFGAWSYSGPASGSESDSDPERSAEVVPAGSHDEISESENESADKSFQCHICRKWYSTRVTLKIHRRVHVNRGGGARRSRARSGDRYECDCCAMTFNRREKLWEHRAEVHRGSMTVRCEVCRKCFEDDAELAAHDRMHTDDERAGRCGECGASFQRFDQLRRHRACAHGAAPGAGAAAGAAQAAHACSVCGKRFGHAHSLTRHMHNHAKQLYRCVVCKASFARADQLAQHLNSHLANYKRLKP